MSTKKRVSFLTRALAVVLVATVASVASAVTVGFERIEPGNAPENVASQFSAEVTDAGAGLVSFKFSNAGPIASYIADIYWDFDGSLLTGFDTIAPDWNEPATPGNLPGGNMVGFSADLSVDADPPPARNGIHPGEMATFILTTGGTFDAIVAALTDGSLRLGLHVQGIGSKGESDGFVSVPVPLPTAAWMGIALLGGLGVAKKTRRTA